jgi:beta-lactamase superfamily II metal-dependent hydrolase
MIGEIKFSCLYAAKAKDLKEHDSHHYVNNMSPFCYFQCGEFIWHTAGDAQNPVNNLFVSAMKKAGISTKCHGLEFHWHTDGNATNENLMNATKPKICCSNYHHPGWHAGRKGPRKKAEKVGATCYATADDGHIEIDISGNKVTVTTSRSGKHDTYTI